MLKIILSLLLISPALYAEEKLGLSNESSLGYVVTGGNSQSETTSIKHQSIYSWTRDILKLNAHYLQASGFDQEREETVQSAENWAATLRFEKVLTPKKFNAFVAHGWYGDRFQNVSEGHSTDIGAKYFWTNSDSTKFFSELGYRYTRELLRRDPTNGGADPDARVGVGNVMMPEYHYARLYTQFDYIYSKTLTFGAWVEYLPSITSFSDDQRINYSPYLTSVLSDIFSLKVAYESRYRFKPAIQGNKLVDYTFTTSLLAKF